MSNDRFFSIFDLGSSKIRLGVFDDILPNSKICHEIQNTDPSNEEIFLNDPNYQNIQSIILKIEKTTNQHLKNSCLMFDNDKSFSVDVSIKKKYDNIYIKENLCENLTQEVKILVEKNYSKFKIIHILIDNYIIDGIIYDEIPQDKIVNELIIGLKFILMPIKKIENIRNILKKNQISISNIYNSSYIKTLDYLKNFNNFEIKVFIDIGFKKTTIILYQNDKLIHFYNISIGGEHITKDISKMLKIDFHESENLKKKLKQSNLTLENNESNDLLIKVVHARVEEIIDLSFKSINDISIINKKKSILIFTGEGSKILSKNSIYLNEYYNSFDEMNFFEENPEIISSAGFNYFKSEKKGEATIIAKTYKKRGFFEKLFYFVSK